jgi:hypothetical protein
MKFTLEHTYKVFNDEDGSYVEVSPDADGLSCVEIRDYDSTGKLISNMTMPPEQAILVAKAITMLADDLAE